LNAAVSTSTTHLSAQAQNALPTHIAIIMDGNGRWAKERHLPRVEGHRNGVESVRATVRACGEIGVKYLTLYAFSVENWNRPKDEVDTLMKYLARYLKNEIGELNRNNVKLEVIGQIYRLPEFVQEQLKKTQAALAKNNGLTLILALSYGGRTEIVETVRAIAEKVKQGKLEPAEINEQVIAQHLYTRHMPDPDLLIRTSGEMRVSNFLLWQISYSELVVTPTLWPDFRKPQLFAAIEEYARRNRRFGGV
jgi:undecaprenyl diphosphate synthase